MNENVTTIIVALISGVFSLIGYIYGNKKSQSKTLYRIDQLEKKQDKHNSLIERMYKAESSVLVLGEQVHSLSNRLNTIEQSVHNPNHLNTM
ncbi:MAG: hypothetical protein ACI4IF_08195 [Acutalibacteraceae bacterium]